MQRKIVKGTSPFEDKQIAIFEVVDKLNVRICTQEGESIISSAECKSIRSKPRSAKYLHVKKNMKDKDLKNKSLVEQYNMFIDEAKLISELTKGKVNLFRTGSVAKTSMQLFYDLSEIPTPDKIEVFETKIIESCYNGAMIFAIPYEGIGYQYDICSQYPSILRSDHFQIPFGKGELKTLTSVEMELLPYFKYGIYHIKIVNPDYRLLRCNKINWHTHTELNRAKELKYKLELIEDDKPNALLYTKLINGAKLFRPFIDYLFPFKKAGHKFIKKYINVLAGALCKKNITTVTTKENDTIYENKTLVFKRPLGKQLDDMYSKVTEIDICELDNLYESDWARIKPFLVATARCKISKIIEQNLDSVIYCHTDGIKTRKPIHKDQKLGDDIGDLKFEGMGNIKVINATTVLNELYKPIPNYSNYEVSNFGNVRNIKKNKLVEHFENKVKIKRNDGKKRLKSINKLVLKIFPKN
jgi:hypothetical protein